MSWHGYPRSRPVRVDDGIRARSTRGAIGESWWSRRLIDVLESFSLGTRLTRGRAYARAGQVVAVEIAPGAVTARVQGSRRQPYQVRIGLAPFRDPVWERVETALAGQALYSAQLLAGELPADLEGLFAEAGAPLFPATAADLAMTCSCPDWQVPCKHLAATCYLLAEELDEDPFQLLHWRGRSREQLLSRLRVLRAGAGGAAGAGAGDAGAEAAGGRLPWAAAAVAGVVGPELDGCLDRYWHPAQPLPCRPATIDTEPGLVLRQLGLPDRRIGGSDLVAELRSWYAEFGDITVPDGAGDATGNPHLA